MANVGLEVVDLWERFFHDEATKDVTIVAQGGDTIKVHGAFLSIISDVFRAMLTHRMEESRTQKIKLQDFTKDQLQFFFRLAYTGQVEPKDWPEGMRKSANKSIGQKGKGKSMGKSKLKDKGMYDDMGLPTAPPPSESSTSAFGPVPLELLLAAAELSKKYELKGFLQKHVDKIGARLELDISNFNKIFSFAINQDISPLRMRCLCLAERDARVHTKFAASEFSPEVMFELQAIWEPAKPATRKRRFFEAE